MSVQTNVYVTVEDYDGETSNVVVNLQDVAPGAGYDSLMADADEIEQGIDALTIGVIRGYKISTQHQGSTAAVTNIQAARESKWVVTYRDTTELLNATPGLGNPGYNKLFSFEIPCADRTLLAGGSDELDLTAPAIAAAIALLEPNIRSPYNRGAAGLTPTNDIVSIRFVGRNL